MASKKKTTTKAKKAPKAAKLTNADVLAVQENIRRVRDSENATLGDLAKAIQGYDAFGLADVMKITGLGHGQLYKTHILEILASAKEQKFLGKYMSPVEVTAHLAGSLGRDQGDKSVYQGVIKTLKDLHAAGEVVQQEVVGRPVYAKKEYA